MAERLFMFDTPEEAYAEAQHEIALVAKTKCKRLVLSFLRLDRCPPDIGQLTSLAGLELNDNQISSLPPAIGQLVSLRELDLNDNRLSSLPPALGQLANLAELWLIGNQLLSLPPEIGQLNALRALYAQDNQLSTLPPEIGQLTALTVLDLSNNQLSTLPPEIGRLTNLERLFLHDNPLLGLPPEVLGPTWDDVRDKNATPTRPADILAYYFRTQKAARPLHEAKMILVGRGTVGKTCLVERLVHDRFADQTKTEGIQITPWDVDLPDRTRIHLNVWDFGGQEIMHATHQFFLTERSLYLLVLNGREGGEDSDAEYWLKLIGSFGGDSPVIVVLNKIGEHPFDLNRRALKEKHPAIVGFIRTDCKQGMGIDDLYAAIRAAIAGMGGVRAKFPAAWFDIKERLGRMRESEKQGYVSFERYRTICRELGEKEGQAQEELAGHLHCLGIALNYKDDPRLRDTSVLNPHWVTNGIYRLLNARCLEEQRGVLRVGDLAGLLPAGEYPPEKHVFLLDLMRKFKLCFAFPEDGEGRHLVPELLGKEEPDLSKEFVDGAGLRFEYHYGVLPEGLLPSFIARSHVLSRGQPRWRSGVVLQWEGCRALVKADAAERFVMIHVKGPTADGRRRLLAVIRADLERIHGEIKRLEVTAKVPVGDPPTVRVDYEELVGMERAGEKEIKRFIAGGVLSLNISQMLNGVDLAPRPSRAERSIAPDRSSRAARVFISYCHKDESLREELETHLKLFQYEKQIDLWTDRRIAGGEEWAKEIDANLNSADIILLLVSADFIASGYCWGIETTRAMERHEASEACVVPVILRDCRWSTAPFAKLQAFPRDAKAVTLWPDRDSAWRNVADGIAKVLEQRRGRVN